MALKQTTDTNTFLFAWNPIKWPWPEISEATELLESGDKYTDTWTCVSHKKVKPGDRAFFSKVGPVPRGIFASGKIISEPFIGRSSKKKEAFCVKIEFDTILDPSKTDILTLDILNIGQLAKQVWTPQSSGISIRPEFAEELELLWEDFLRTKAAGTAFEL